MNKEHKNEEGTEKDQTPPADPASDKTIPPLLHKPNASRETINQLKETLSSMLHKKEGTLFNAIEKISMPSRSSSASLEDETAQMLYELDTRIVYWESVYKKTFSTHDKSSKSNQKHPRHLEIIALLHKIEKELELMHEDIDILGSDTKLEEKSSEVLPLFDLLEKEFMAPKKKLNVKSTFPDFKTLDKSDLEKELKRYEALVSKNELEKTGKKITKKKKIPISKEEDLLSLIESDDDEDSEEKKSPSLEAPPLFSTFLAFVFDFTLLLGGVFLYMWYRYSELRKLLIRLPEDPQIALLMPHLITFAVIFSSAWVLVLFIFQVLYDGTPGQRLFGIVVCNTKGQPPKISQLLARITMHSFTVLTLGIRSLMNMRKDHTFYCSFSKTRTALLASITKEEETYLI